MLTSPYLAWVLRYMQPHDDIFIKPGTPGHPIYQKWFGNKHGDAKAATSAAAGQ